MSQKQEKDYVLGTHDEEIARLGLQHRIWRPFVLDCWRRAGITTGSRVVDVGAGPGCATVDLAEIVGPTGKVLAVERSRRFIDTARQSCETRTLSQVAFQEADIMDTAIDAIDLDAAWCRWVACFVASPATLLRRIKAALKPGGVAIFHEYSNYATWQVIPRKPAVESFVNEVMASWRAQGGEPNIALQFPELLRDAGFTVMSVQPRVFTVTPRDKMWQWPASFIEINLTRLKNLGRVTQDWTDSVRAEFREAQENPATWLTTPMVLEIVARAT